MKASVFFDLLIFRTGANLRAEVSKYYLNFLWWVISPLSAMVTYYMIFGIFMNRGKPNFVGFLLVGITSWQWFASTVNNAAGSIIGGRGLMLQVNIPKIFFPLEVLLRDAFKQFFVLTLLIVFLCFYTTPVSITWLALPILIFIQSIINAGVAILCAALVPFIPDLRFIIQTVMHLAFFASGIFYSLDDIILPKHQFIVYLNPMAGLIKNYREVLLYAHWPNWTYLFFVTLFGLGFLAAMVRLVFHFDHAYPRICQQ